MKRRVFAKQASTLLAGGVLGSPSLMASPKINSRLSPNDKLQIGVIGCNGMGWSNTNSMLKMNDVDLVGLCDVDQNVVNRRLGDYAKLRKNKPKVYGDYRDLLADEAIDAVIIGSPDHWHCKMMVDAVQNGKHVYVEKPLANSIEECNIMVGAAEKSQKVVQVGQWQRSGTHYQKALEVLQSGVLGNIRLVKVWAYQGWMKPVPKLADSQVPKGVDYDFWLGPAPKRPFNQNRFHFNFRWFWDYAGGLMTDWGVHEIDIALYFMKAIAPVSVMATGGKIAYPDDASETPDTLQAIFEYDGFNMLWEHATGIDNGPYGRREGIAFIGNNGTLVVNRGGYEVMVEKRSVGYSKSAENKMAPIEAYQKPAKVKYLDLHTQNFIDAVKKNDPSGLKTPIKSGSLAAINAHMGNIAYKTGRKVYWDQAAGKFKDDEAANKLLLTDYQNGWELPGI
ncbi:Gfo/Idh/MocA family oxidoreductase [Fulvivirgaceae bacterium BMA12]|uniref:Gfo/Idh/MocA family oxidoreductase n=1 Tax=Agaribacillus aureus TaxID=3051825 RepID=A0ABT8KYA7_9BACT|nr:Gfo/Idh/MocA family oxidoreductase [Fulvivirgaceae bacterium BMA12]